MAKGAAKDFAMKLDTKAGTLVEVTDDITSINFSNERGVIDVTTFGKNYREFITGVSNFTMTLEALYDPAVSDGLADTLAFTASGTATQTLTYELYPQGTASGKVKISGECYVGSYSGAAALDEAVTVSAELQNSGTVTYATV